MLATLSQLLTKTGSSLPCTVIIKLNSGVYNMHETPQGNHYHKWMFRARTEENMSYDYWESWRHRGNQRVTIKPSSTALLSRTSSVLSLNCMNSNCMIFGIYFPNNPNAWWKWLAKCDKQCIIYSLPCLWFSWTEFPFFSQMTQDFSILLAHACASRITQTRLLCSIASQALLQPEICSWRRGKRVLFWGEQDQSCLSLSSKDTSYSKHRKSWKLLCNFI